MEGIFSPRMEIDCVSCLIVVARVGGVSSQKYQRDYNGKIFRKVNSLGGVRCDSFFIDKEYVGI